MSGPNPPSGEKPGAAPDGKHDNELDVAEEDSFPASDPPAMTDPAKSIRKPRNERS
ncbi:MAG TPA: hypothetical protein VE650_02060 [Acetobacteraceae bacterium]|nr:hypothetical protein [Acetobacteraceae bacterium]